jgi:hypothetical protein
MELSGAGVLDGTLELSLLLPYEPSPGDMIEILAAAGGLGATTFAEVVQPAGMPAGLTFDVVYNPTGLQLVVISQLLLGDLDCDGDVDFDDIDDFVLGLTDPQEYENQFGLAPEVKGDTDGDGDIDFDDIDDFVAILTAADSAGTQTVPEPGTAALFLLGAGVMAFCGAHRQNLVFPARFFPRPIRA